MPVAIIYCRQSLGRSDETTETSLSLDMQEQKCREWAERERVSIDRVFRDRDVRGWTLERDEWTAAVEHIARGGVDLLLAFSMDRIARDGILQEIAWRQVSAHKCRMVSVTEPWAEDDLVRGILGAVNQHARKTLGKFVDAALTERVRRGQTVHNPPFGLRLTGSPGERNRQIEPDPETFPIAREMADRLLSGQTVYQVQDWLVSSGIPAPRGGSWSWASINRWLSAPSIAGAAHRRDLIIWDATAAIVTTDEFAEMQRLRAATKYQKSTVRYDSWLRGSIRHACGRRMILFLAGRKNGKPGSFSYSCVTTFQPRDLRCPVRPFSGSQRKIEPAVLTALHTDLDGLLSVQDALTAWQGTHGGQRAVKRRESLTKAISTAETAHQRAEQLYLSGSRDAAWLAEQDRTYAEKIAAAKAELAALDTPPDPITLTAARTRIQTIAASLAAMNDDQLRVTMASLGTAIVSTETLAIRYDPEIAPLIPEPAVVPWTAPS